jgi:ATP synthase protein I
VALRPRPPATSLGRALGAGIEFAAAIGIGMAIGYWADSWLGTEPWLMLVFLGFGFAAGIRNLLRLQARLSGETSPDSRGTGPK